MAYVPDASHITPVDVGKGPTYKIFATEHHPKLATLAIGRLPPSQHTVAFGNLAAALAGRTGLEAKDFGDLDSRNVLTHEQPDGSTRYTLIDLQPSTTAAAIVKQTTSLMAS